jgi:uncharacterized membrane protein
LAVIIAFPVSRGKGVPVKMSRLCRLLTAFFTCLLLITLLSTAPVCAQETEDSQLFLSGFNAYQQKDYPVAVSHLGEVLQKFPDSSLRDMTLFWLARAHYKAGSTQDAARYMAQFTREYPDNPLKNTVEEDLLSLAAQYEKNQGAPAQVVVAEKQDLAKQQAAAEQAAQAKAQQAGAAEKAALLKAKAETDRLAREKAETERLTSLKREEEKRVAAAEMERVAREQAERDRAAVVKVEAERIAQEKAAQEAAEKARILRAKVDAERIVREKLEAERLATAEAERVAQAAAAKTQAEQAQAEAERLAAVKRADEQKQRAEVERVAQHKAETERLAKLKVAEDLEKKAQLQKATAAAELAAQTKAEEQRAAAARAEAKRQAAEKTAAAAVAQREQKLAAARKLEENRLAAEKMRQDRIGLKEKAISEYKTIIERFPDSSAARTAAARLKELGVAVPVATVGSSASEPTTATAQVLTLEVAQYAAFEFDLHASAAPVEVARKAVVPFELTNKGNGQDSFYLAAGFPTEFNARFASASAPELTINQTPQLATGDTFKGLLLLNIPATTIDGLRIAYPVKAASQFMAETSQSRVVSLVAAAPLLRAVIKADKSQLLPGERLQYRLTIMNLGSTAAQDVTLRLNYPAQYQPDGTSAGFRQEMDAALVLDGIALKPGESRDLTAGFQLKDGALAKEELMVRADLLNNTLQTKNSFLSNASFVVPVSGLSIKLATDKVKAVPGQTVTIPVRITNKGNQRERFNLIAGSAPFQTVVLYHDLNRDGLRQPGEPAVNAIGPLGPKEEAALLIEVATLKGAQDGTVERLSLTAVPESSQNKAVTVDAQIAYSRPVVQLAMKGREGRMVPGELLTVQLDILNSGSNLAKLVDLQVTWPSQLELVAADQAESSVQPGVSAWHFSELGAGEKRTIKASFRIKTGTVVGTGLQVKSTLTYQDQIGNRY